MLTRFWDWIYYIVTGINRDTWSNEKTVTAKWDYGLWTRYRYVGTRRRGCGKHNLYGSEWILTRDFTSTFDWILDWKERWTKFWQMEEEWILSQS